MQIAYLDCDKKQGIVEITFSKREIQLDRAFIQGEYKMVANKEYKVTYYIGCAGYEVMNPLYEEMFSGTSGEVKEKIRNTVEGWMNNKDAKTAIKNEMKKMVSGFDLGYKSLKMIQVDLNERLAGYGNIDVIAEINEVKKVFIVYVRDIFNGLLKVYENSFSVEVDENDIEEFVAKCIQDDIEKINIFLEQHKAEVYIY